MTTRQRGGLLRRKKETAEDKAFTPEKVQQRVQEYNAVKNKPAKSAPAATSKPTEKYDENEGIGFDQAFAKAKKSGDGTFKWKGKMYNTNTKSVPKGQSGTKIMPAIKKKNSMYNMPASFTEPKDKRMPIAQTNNIGVPMPTGRALKLGTIPKKKK